MLGRDDASLRIREQVLGVWETWVEVTSGPWRWGDSVNVTRNAVMDAEQLNCLLLPQAMVDGMTLQRHRKAAPDVARVLGRLATQTDRRGDSEDPTYFDERATSFIVDVLLDFMKTHRSADGIPTFDPGSYLGDERPAASDDRPWVVDGFALSVPVCVFTLTLIRRWKEGNHKDTFRNKLTELEEVANERLTASLIGLLLSFTATEIGRGEWEEQTGRVWNVEAAEDVRRRLDALELGVPEKGVAFECGWSWGIDSESIGRVEDFIDLFDSQEITRLMRGMTERTTYLAEPYPYFYFTVVALDRIASLFSSQVQSSGVLTSEHLALANRLRIYVESTSEYWTALARARSADGRWEIERVPWRSSAGVADDYFTLYLLGIVFRNYLQGRTGRRSAQMSERDLESFVDLLEELGQRARILRDPYPAETDTALSVHRPGRTAALNGIGSGSGGEGSGSSPYTWKYFDFAPELLKRVGELLEVSQQSSTSLVIRQRLVTLTERIWGHLEARKLEQAAIQWKLASWDDLSSVYPEYVDRLQQVDRSNLRIDAAADEGAEPPPISSWYFTERVVSALVSIAQSEGWRPAANPTVQAMVREILTQLDAVLGEQERRAFAEGGGEDLEAMRASLSKAQAAAEQSPIEALGLALDASRQFYESSDAARIARANRDANR